MGNKSEMDRKLEELDRRIMGDKKHEKGLVATCAKCGSANITMTQTPAMVHFRELKGYYCRDCNYEGTPILKKLK